MFIDSWRIKLQKSTTNVFNINECKEPKEVRKMKKQLLSIIILLVAITTFVVGLSPGTADAIPNRTTGQPGATPDYFTTPNWAISPPLTKFVNTLPGIPMANPDIVTYPGSDYYEIELREYSQLMHTGLVNETPLRGYVQTNDGTNTAACTDPALNLPSPCTIGNNTVTPAAIQYLGPLIIAKKDRPVRVKFTNSLTPNSKLFLPVDTTVMGSGAFEINYDPKTKLPSTTQSGMFSQNRATLHLHGGRTPWISDGTPHQWITPVGETTTYPKGVSVQNVPDMPDPGPGSQTFYWTNQQSARLMFYHDHAWGITRLNVYAGEAAGYLITDDAEQDLIKGGVLDGLSYGTPLIIQDKTFVDPLTIKSTDPTWAWGSQPWNGSPGAAMTPFKGDLWWPHVYMPAQNPYNPDLSGMNAMGRWHYGPWFWPPTPLCFGAGGTDPLAVPPYCVSVAALPNPYYDPDCDPYGGSSNPEAPIVNICQPPEMPGTPEVSWGAEAFLDTMLVNGMAYPKVTVAAGQQRFRVLNASHDRFLNLQLYVASPIVSGITITDPGSGYTYEPTVTITGNGTGATAVAIVDLDPLSPDFGKVIAIDLLTVGSGYTTASVAITGGGGAGATADATVYTALTEVGMVPAAATAGFPPTWPTDGREGGVPDPARRGPAIIQIASEGGFLPGPVLLNNQPVQWNLDPTMFNVGNVLQVYDGGGTLFLGPAERADIIVDFTGFDGRTLILYNDAPTAFPALDPHYDYYTGAPDRTDIGANLAIPPGVGPNIRTVMQINVGTGGSSAIGPVNAYNPTMLADLKTKFKAVAAGGGGLFETSQPPMIVGQRAYGLAYNEFFPGTYPNWGVSRISDNYLSFEQPGVPGLVSNFPMKPKAIHDEMGGTFDDYGRMSAKLGLEVPFSNAAISTFALQNYVDPATEILSPNKNLNVNLDSNGIQIWKITHNGVDTHPIHFHLFDVQVINRVGWDGFIRLPDENELGWKDTVRMAPLEDTIVALRPVTPQVPFAQPDSIRPLNPSTPTGSMMGFSQIDPLTGAALATPIENDIVSFNHEYVWHCHILSHEENDMMRPIIFQVPTYSISGKVTSCGAPAAGVNVIFGASNAVATTDTNGNYIFTGMSNGWYIVTPSMTGVTYIPANRTGTITANVTQVNFTLPSGVSVSGTVRTAGGTPLTGITVSLTGAANATTTTDIDGNYTFGGLCNGSYLVSPIMTGQTFAPLSRNVTVNGANMPGQDFTSYSIGDAVDNTSLTWTTGGNANWAWQAAISYYGGDAAQSGTITHSQSTWVQTTVTGPGTLSFYWKVSSESNYDYLRFYIDGAEQSGKISGEVNWQQKSYTIPSGTHTLKWAYTKDVSINKGSDKGWLDYVVLTPLPTVTIVATDSTATEAGPTTGQFTITRTGATTSALTVYYGVSGTATSGSDYNSIGTSVTIPVGSSTATITVTPINDTAVESDETVVVTLSSNAAYKVGSPSSATVTIISDDVVISLGNAVDNTSWTWTTGGNANWDGQAAISYYGGDAAQSGTITHSQSTWVQTTVSGPGTLSYYWKASSESGYDYLRFYIDGVEQSGKISGEVNWTLKTYSISSGSHTLKWAYTKDGSLNKGSDKGWLDYVVFTP